MPECKIFNELKMALESALAYERGEKVNLRVTRMPAPAKKMSPKEIKEIRHALHASQVTFATSNTPKTPPQTQQTKSNRKKP